MYETFKPLVLSMASPFAGGCKVPSILGQPEDGGPEPEKPEPEEPKPKKSEPKASALSTSQTSQEVQKPVAEALHTNPGKTGGPIPEQEPPHRGPKVKVTRQL